MKTRCECCKEVLKQDRITWLELSITDGNYYRQVPKGHKSQGFFPFGATCAKNKLNKTREEVYARLSKQYRLKWLNELLCEDCKGEGVREITIEGGHDVEVNCLNCDGKGVEPTVQTKQFKKH